MTEYECLSDVPCPDCKGDFMALSIESSLEQGFSRIKCSDCVDFSFQRKTHEEGLIKAFEKKYKIKITGVKYNTVKLVELVKRIIDNNDTPYDDALLSTVDGYIFSAQKQADCDDDWYIQVKPIDGGYLYDGWWGDSSEKTLLEVAAEAVIGSEILIEE
jgi:hypothetical protein